MIGDKCYQSSIKAFRSLAQAQYFGPYPWPEFEINFEVIFVVLLTPNETTKYKVIKGKVHN